MRSSTKWVRSLLVISCMLTIGASACRSRKKNATIGSGSFKIIIAIKNMEDVSSSKFLSMQYEASCTNSADWIRGEISDQQAQEVTFLMRSAKVGDTCQVRALVLNPPPEFTFLGGERVAFHTETPVRLASKTGGQLWGEGLFVRDYKLRAGRAVLKIPVQFKEELPKNPENLRAELKCEPEFEGLATNLVITDAANRKGELTFDSGLNVGTTYKCNKIQLRNATEYMYFGNMNETFTQSQADQQIVAKQVSMELVDITITEGVVIVVTKGEACKEGIEVFDIDQGRCVPSPR